MSTPTVSEIKSAYQSGDCGYFFDRDTMKFFGDRIRSFATIRHDGKVYLYRRPSAIVNVFGTRKKAGRDYFRAWEFDQESGALDIVNDEIEDEIYNLVSHR